MLFNSLSFAVFFPVVTVIYFLIPAHFRVFFLLVTSCVFYMAFVPKYILILFALITLDFFLASAIEKARAPHRLHLLWISISANIGMLFFFKYLNFFNINIAALASVLHWNYSPALLSIALPLGLSFHVFQSLSYVIEVYRGTYVSERNYFVYATYVMFFPQLVAGPIERPGHLLPQFYEDHPFDAVRVRRGLERMLWGFFKKLVIADNIAPIINHQFLHTPNDGPIIILVALLFAYQLYCDFSGYSDIAIGAALVLGYNIMENFNRPYASRSIAEFWRRWHISLSSWLRDYLYIPLGGSRVTSLRHYLNLFTTFVLVGMWHGANWTYVCFGALHGLSMVAGSATESLRQTFAELFALTKFPNVRSVLGVISTFTLVCIGWLVFRSQDISQAWHLISHLGTNIHHLFDTQYWLHILTVQIFGARKSILAVIVIAILAMEMIQFAQARANTLYIWETRSKVLRLVWNYSLLFSILLFGSMGSQVFIYFQF